MVGIEGTARRGGHVLRIRAGAVQFRFHRDGVGSAAHQPLEMRDLGWRRGADRPLQPVHHVFEQRLRFDHGVSRNHEAVIAEDHDAGAPIHDGHHRL